MTDEHIRYWVRGSDEQTYGPVDIATLDSWAEQHKVTADTLLCRENDPSNQWIRACELPQLSFAASVVPVAPQQAQPYWSGDVLIVPKDSTVGHGQCVMCGAVPAEPWKQKYTWTPPWTAFLILVAVLIYIIVAIILQKKGSVHLTTCKACQSKWKKTTLFIVLEGFLGLFAFPFLFGMLGSYTGLYEGVFGVLFGFLVWLVGLLVLVLAVKPRTQVLAKKIDDQTIALKFPNPAQAKAVLHGQSGQSPPSAG